MPFCWQQFAVDGSRINISVISPGGVVTFHYMGELSRAVPNRAQQDNLSRVRLESFSNFVLFHWENVFYLWTPCEE